MRLALDPSSEVPLFRQIAGALRSRVGVGSLGAGDPLPATRDAAAAWGVNRHTVARAYRELVRAGVLERGGRGSVRVARKLRGRGDEREVAALLDATLERAASLGVGPDELLDRIRARTEERSTAVTAVECTPDQCVDLAERIATDWLVAVRTFCLEDEGEPPAGPFVTTLAHLEEVRARWPRRAADARFVTAGLDPSLRSIVRHLLASGGVRPLHLLVEHDLEGGRALAESLARLAEVESDRVEVGIAGDVSERGARQDRVVRLATPCGFRALPERVRRSPWTVRIRYAPEPAEMEALAASLGWRRRQPDEGTGARAAGPARAATGGGVPVHERRPA